MKSNAQLLQEAIQTLSDVGRPGSLGINRWDQVVDEVPSSGIVSIPVMVGQAAFTAPFYYVIEQSSKERLVFCKPSQGGEPYRLGDVFGFFGLTHFDDFKIGSPIILVEGITDWRAVRLFYPYVLCTFTAGISTKQMFFLRNLTRKVLLGFDKDEAGARAVKNSMKKLRRLGITSKPLQPPQSDFGEMLESEWGIMLLERQEKRITRLIESW